MANGDYKAVCQDLFWTTDVDELKRLAAQINQKNPRQAGRKKKFKHEDVERMRELRADGVPMQEIADRYGTSRQIVSKYLNQAPEDGYTMRMTLMYQNRPCTAIDVNFLQNKIKIQNYTKDILHRAFGIKEDPTWEDFYVFLQDRCFPKTRGNVKTVLAGLGLQDYDPLQIVEKTNGRTAEDDLWLKFQYYGRAGA
jgi:hypothetical protein